MAASPTDSDYYGDELPFWQTVEGKPHLIVPYSPHQQRRQVRRRHDHRRPVVQLLRDAFDVLYKEGATAPR